MKKQQLPQIQRINDLPELEVFNNIDGAIRKLRRRVGAAGTLRALKYRRQEPSVQGRRRAKDRRAKVRYQKEQSQ